MSSAIWLHHTKYVHLQLKHIEDYIKMYCVCNNAVNPHCTRSIRLLAAVNKAMPIVTMAIASGLAGRVLAWPFFHEINVHMRNLNTHEVLQIKTNKPSCLWQWMPIIVQISLMLRLSAILAYSMAIPYCDKVHATHGTCTQLSLWNLKSRVLFPSPRPAIFSSSAVRTASDQKLGGSLGTRL